jgi:hypothetical protein
VIFGERHLHYLIKEFVEHYMTERFHQGIGAQPIKKQFNPTMTTGAMARSPDDRALEDC